MSPARKPPLTFARLFFAVILAVSAARCGNITLGQGTSNDPEPSGTIVAQGNLIGVNGRSVTGTVAVYQQIGSASNCTFVVRLQNLSAPSDAGLQVIPVVNGAPTISPTFYVLRSPTGNENYIFSNASCAAAFAQLQISNPAVSPPSAQNFGVATLTAP